MVFEDKKKIIWLTTCFSRRRVSVNQVAN